MRRPRAQRRPAGARARIATLVCVAIVVAAGCDGGDGGGADGDRTDDGATGSLFVSATASVSAAMSEIAEAFESEYGGAEVSVNIANSAALATQINEGAPVDVFASADETNMQVVVDGIGTIDEPVVFATNEPQILVGPGNPFGVGGLADLTDPDIVYVGVVPDAPIARYVAEVLERAGVELAPRSLEESVIAASTKVTLGEADATIVFATDVLAAGDRGEGIVIPPGVNVVATYPIAVPSEAPNPTAAAAFVEFVLGDSGRAILESYGFGLP